MTTNVPVIHLGDGHLTITPIDGSPTIKREVAFASVLVSGWTFTPTATRAGLLHVSPWPQEKLDEYARRKRVWDRFRLVLAPVGRALNRETGRFGRDGYYRLTWSRRVANFIGRFVPIYEPGTYDAILTHNTFTRQA